MKFVKDFALEVFFSKYEFSVKYNIGGSDIQSVTIGQLLALCSREELTEFENLYLGYTETYGSPALLQAIAGTYENISTDNILCFAGAEEGLFAAMNAILEADDHAMVVFPNYQSAETVPLGICEVTGIPLDPENNWAMDLDFVKDRIKPNTKLISVNFPNNPTGKIIDRAAYADLVELCRKHGIYLFSDEVYRLIERTPETRLPQGADVYEKAVSLNVMSKAYGLAGLRIGWLAGRDKEILIKSERIKHYLSICNSGPSELLATIALRNSHKILERNRKLVEANLALLNEFFGNHTDLFEWSVPDGGCVGFPRYKGPGRVEEFIDRIVNDLGILFLPATLFQSDLGESATDRFRVGFGREFFPEAIAKLDDYLNKGK